MLNLGFLKYFNSPLKETVRFRIFYIAFENRCHDKYLTIGNPVLKFADDNTFYNLTFSPLSYIKIQHENLKSIMLKLKDIACHRRGKLQSKYL